MRPSNVALALTALLSACSPSAAPNNAHEPSKDHASNAKRGPAAPGRVAAVSGVFSPHPAPPDHELVIEGRDYGPKPVVERTLKRHGNWVRIDTRGAALRNSRWVNVPSGLTINSGSAEDSRGVFLEIWAPRGSTGDTLDYGSHTTGETKAIARERCKVWNVYRNWRAGQQDWAHFSCVTDDGIELLSWRAKTSKDPVTDPEITKRITRRPIAAADVTPPAQTLDLSPWLAAVGTSTAASCGAASSSVELVSNSATRTIRRGCGWTLVDSRRLGLRREITSGPDAGGLELRLTFSQDGRPESFAIRSHQRIPPLRTEPLSRPNLKLLGMECSWVDALPGWHDVGLEECRTADGVTLQAISYTRGDGRTYTAKSVSRAPIKVADLLPPREFMNLETWGVVE